MVPTLLYALLLLSPRTSAQDRRRYKLLERRAHECKSICGAIEAPIQLGECILEYIVIGHWPSNRSILLEEMFEMRGQLTLN